jgi:hypothetical protein
VRGRCRASINTGLLAKGRKSFDMPHCGRLDFGNTFIAEVPTVNRDKE